MLVGLATEPFLPDRTETACRYKLKKVFISHHIEFMRADCILGSAHTSQLQLQFMTQT